MCQYLDLYTDEQPSRVAPPSPPPFLFRREELPQEQLEFEIIKRSGSPYPQARTNAGTDACTHACMRAHSNKHKHTCVCAPTRCTHAPHQRLPHRRALALKALQRHKVHHSCRRRRRAAQKPPQRTRQQLLSELGHQPACRWQGERQTGVRELGREGDGERHQVKRGQMKLGWQLGRTSSVMAVQLLLHTED